MVVAAAVVARLRPTKDDGPSKPTPEEARRQDEDGLERAEAAASANLKELQRQGATEEQQARMSRQILEGARAAALALSARHSTADSRRKALPTSRRDKASTHVNALTLTLTLRRLQ